MRRWPLVGLALAAVAGTLALALATYSAVELARFERAESRRSVVIHAAGQLLAPGTHVRLVDLPGTLSRLRYAETRGAPTAPGQFRRSPGAWEIYLRGVEGTGAERDAHRLRLEIRGERISRVMRDGEAVVAETLEPEVLTSVGDKPGEDYRPVRLADVPLTLVNAVLAAEDHRFFEHHGLDVRGLLRAAWVNVRAGRVTQGGSTITQQLVKNRLLTPQRTYLRKVREAWLATLLEWRYSKERLLEAYLNELYLGQRGGIAIRGVGAASRAYLRKEIHQLTLAESALLAGMARAPNTYSPALNPERAVRRRDVVLQRMRELAIISEADATKALHEPLRVHASAGAGQAAPYFADYVRQEIEERFGDELLDGTRSARILTSVDLALQRFAETAVTRGLDRLETRLARLRRREPTERLQAALIALDPVTGEVRAMVGGRDYGVSQFNRATLARRQPGSAFKPFVYLTALAPRAGRPVLTLASFVEDAPITLTVAGGTWTPRNYQDRYEGRVTVRRALEQSLNGATVRVAETVGLPTVVQTARAMGIESELQPVPAMALGAFEVTPLELARAYLAFANGGVKPPRRGAIHAAYDLDGTAWRIEAGEPAPVMSPAEAYVMTSALTGVVTSGTGSAARSLGVTGDIAGKTGTTNDARDAWFVGYSSRLLALVWVGFDGGDAHGMSAAEAALPIWADFMRQAVDAYPAAPFVMPAGVVPTSIDATNGRAANRFCPLVIREVFVTGTVPPACEEHGGASDHVLDAWKRFRDWLLR